MRPRVVLIIASVLLAGCGRGATGPLATPQPEAAGHFAFSLLERPRTLDPRDAVTPAELTLIRQLFEGLVTWSPSASEPVAGAAYAWEVSDDGRVYLFHLRDGLLWSDGTRLSADDFRFGWLRLLERTAPAGPASHLLCVRNASGYRSGEVEAGDVGLIVIDDTTLMVELETPFPDFLGWAGSPMAFPVPRHLAARRTHDWWRADRFVGNGPFLPVETESGDRIVLKPNRRYRQASMVGPSQLTAFVVGNHDLALRLYRSGGIHWLPYDQLPPWYGPFLSDHPDHRRGRQLTSVFLAINTRRAPLDDPRVRRALAMAVNRPEIADGLSGPDGLALASLTPDGLDGYDSPIGPTFNLVQARSLLRDAGHADGQSLRPLTLLFSARVPAESETARLLAVRYRSALGLRLSPAPADSETDRQRRTAGDFDLMIVRQTANYAAPEAFLLPFATGNAHSTGWNSIEYRALLWRAMTMGNRPERMRRLAEAEDQLLEEAPIVPLYQPPALELLNPGVGGLLPNPAGIQLLRHLQPGPVS